jgi:hypothetical protein
MGIELEKLGNPAKIMEDLGKLNEIELEEFFDKYLDKLHSYNTDSFQSMNQDILNDMVEILTYTFYANYINLRLTSDNASNFSNRIHAKTGSVIKLMIDYFQNPRLRLADLYIINSFTTGSLTTDWVCRSFMWFLAYIIYYNHYIDAGLVTKNIRSDFKTKYYRYYKRRLPSLTPRIEIIIEGGVQKINPEKELPLYVLGALLYDIGKVPHINYHDGNESSNEDTQKLHALAGFNLLVKSKQYPFPILSMAAFHHEYYGGKKSYNFTNSLIAKLFRRERSEGNISNFISSDAKKFIDSNAFAFFPPKFLEVVDVYTGLISKGKHSTAEALTIMKREYIAHSLQIDPILFEIFMEFMYKCELLSNTEKTQIDEIIF